MLSQNSRMTFTARDLFDHDVKATRARHKNVIGPLEALILCHLQLGIDPELAFAVLTPDKDFGVLKKTRLLYGYGWRQRT